MMKKNNKKNRTARKRKGAAMKRRWGRGAAYVLTFALAFLATYLLSSCADHDDMFDSGIRVGNILLSDNTMVAPGSYDAGSMHAVGVVFYAKGDTAIAVAPVELGDHCFSDSLVSVSGISNVGEILEGACSIIPEEKDITAQGERELLDAMQDSMLEAMITAEESGSYDEQEGGPECTS